MKDKHDITIPSRRRKSSSSKKSSAGSSSNAPEKAARRKKRTVWRAGLRLLLVAAVLIGIFQIAVNWKSLAPEKMTDWLEDHFFARPSGDGFPVSISGDTVVEMRSMRRTLAVLTDTSLLLLDTAGGEKAKLAHPFADPFLSVDGNYALVTETDGTRYRLYERTAMTYEGTLSGKVLCGDVSRKGIVAVVSTSSNSGYTSELLVFNAKGKQLLRWQNAKWLITDVSLSNTDTLVAISAVSAQGGAMETAVIVFDYSDADIAPREFTQSDLTLCAIHIGDDGTVFAVGNRELWTISAKATSPVRLAYDGYQLAGYAFSETQAGLVLIPGGTLDGGLFCAVGTDGQAAYRHPFSGNFRDLSADDKRFFLLSSQKLFCFDKTALLSSAETAPDSRLTAAFNGDAVVLGLIDIQEYVF